jgi:hypothetical protein
MGDQGTLPGASGCPDVEGQHEHGAAPNRCRWLSKPAFCGI